PEKSAKSISYDAFIVSLADLIKDDNNGSNPATKFNLTDKAEQNPKIITVIKGYGGHEAIDAKLPKLREMHPDALIISLGPIADNKRSYVDIAAQVTDVSPFLMHSDLLIMACGLNAIAQAYHHKTPLVVLPDERPHREQEVMAEALIAQGRAMSWQQFVDVSKNPPSLGNLLTSSAKPDSNRVSNNTVDETNTKTAAQALMDSFVDYPAAKSWFQDWLLPKLDMTPK
ncbi:hypothetical protein, partial [Psychrobacter submarinus]|uniref:hypothetical protein n=1 Tax=Psychrobacter submarinus TaxID=154108 RepID=UPI003F6A4718